jgi:hypothetical protein
MAGSVKHVCILLCVPLVAVGLSACAAASTSTSDFTGEQHGVAQAIANLQTDATAGDQTKLCADDLASAVVARLDKSPGGCQQAIKSQLAEIENFEVTIESIQLAGSPAKRTATASVKSTYAGKSRVSTLSLLEEDGKWKLSSAQ